MQQQTRAPQPAEPATALSPSTAPPDFGSNAAAAGPLGAPQLPDSLWVMGDASDLAGIRERRFQFERMVERLPPDQREYLYAMQRENPPKWTAEAYDQLDVAKRSRPLGARDRAGYRAAAAAVDALDVKVVDDGSDPNLVQILVTFDGTGNDREQDAHDTNPARLADLAPNSIYERGVGVDFETRLVGGATGAGADRRLEDAYRQALARIATERKARPEAQFVFVLTGFSRGAALARSFANLLVERGVPSPRGGTVTPRIGALAIFDTVQTGMSDAAFPQQIPPEVENVLHLTAAGERRMAFPLTTVQTDGGYDPRLGEVALPGAHSDIGGSYPNAYSRLPLDLMHRWLGRAGVKVDALPEGFVPDIDDPSLRLHDSSWLLDRWFDPRRSTKAPPALAAR